MKKYIIMLFTVLGLLINAQNIKTKRGIVSLDGVPVAKITSKSNEYTFLDLKETPLYTIEFIDKSIVDSIRDSYIKLNRVYNRDKTIDLDYISPSAFSGDEKSAVYTSVKGFKIIDNKGINVQKLDELFANMPKRKLDTKTKEAYTIRNKIDKLQLEVNNVGEILSKGERVGYFTNLPVSFGSENMITEKTWIDIEIYDANNKYIGKYITTTKQIKTANGKSFTLYKDISGRASLLKFPTYQSLVERIIIMDPNFIKVQDKVIVGQVQKDGVEK
ncbi:hypothetical protein M2347_003628 [Chryseobacterium sp. H1D6B]|uniref:hypothetical protein n=1 Tax=Chryseobacterium sp. H1D6B TaxID=2940588 RepID=UPI0015C866AD|nr:hypothetical protein [Chryseobacterium sp. H1D6B]MDH6253901.1 hypothetical protein [Chryseobacterium sp. H1D6B]